MIEIIHTNHWTRWVLYHRTAAYMYPNVTHYLSTIVETRNKI